jgi:hypothetical protein
MPPAPGKPDPQPEVRDLQPEVRGVQATEPVQQPEEGLQATERALQPEQPGREPGEPGVTSDPDDGSRGPSPTGPNDQLGGQPAARAGRNPTGDAVVDRALDELDALPGQPLDRHIEVGQQVHRALQARLADIGRE